MFSFLQVIM